MLKRLLIAPMDWGIGHATRCVPIIQALERLDIEVVVASSGRAAALLKDEFPYLRHLELPAYDIRYPSRHMYWNIALQGNKILHTARKEHRQIQQWIDQYQLGGLMSDNRFGCFSAKVPSVFLTHQVNIDIPFWPLSQVVNYWNHWIIRRYQQCWIPDWPGDAALAGKLSVASSAINSVHIGPLSRFKPKQLAREWDALVLLSGPEPQRSYLEASLLEQLAAYPGKVLIVQGKPELKTWRIIDQKIHIRSHLNANELNHAVCAADLVVCRSGYSTLMDLCVLGKKALLIPTPGQTEQEYLAQRFQAKGYCAVQPQYGLDLVKGLEEARKRSGIPTKENTNEALENAIENLFLSI
ncbi:MAG TPA: glycosyltransferase [Saprospiraceae bacterium]|nr:glycosyltransferase [Saprospiraceae bacterium]HMQ81691.1 glycosyltransferase [Saprospiraceae bacterium]